MGGGARPGVLFKGEKLGGGRPLISIDGCGGGGLLPRTGRGNWGGGRLDARPLALFGKPLEGLLKPLGGLKFGLDRGRPLPGLGTPRGGGPRLPPPGLTLAPLGTFCLGKARGGILRSPLFSCFLCFCASHSSVIFGGGSLRIFDDFLKAGKAR